MRNKRKLFAAISEYCDVLEILVLAKVDGLGMYKRLLKKQLKTVLYDVSGI